MDFSKYVKGKRLTLPSRKINISKLVEFFQDNQHITELDLSDNFISDGDAKKLAELTNLIYLDLSCNNISDECVKELVNGKLLNLTSLNLSNNFISGKGAQELANSPYLKNLKYLNLGFNRIGGKGVKELVNGNLPKLSFLDLSYNNIDDKCAQELANSPYLKNLKYLNLGFNRIGGKGIEALARSKCSGIKVGNKDDTKTIFYDFLLEAYSNNQVIDKESTKKMIFNVAQHNHGRNIIEYILKHPDEYPVHDSEVQPLLEELEKRERFKRKHQETSSRTTRDESNAGENSKKVTEDTIPSKQARMEKAKDAALLLKSKKRKNSEKAEGTIPSKQARMKEPESDMGETVVENSLRRLSLQ